MTTESIGTLDPPSEPRPAATVVATRPFLWSVRRELWETRQIYFAPLIVAALVLLGFLISAVRLVDKIRDVLLLDPTKQAAALDKLYGFAAIPIILTSVIVAVFYCLDALHGERRDRSILFWKSLPVSDITTVLAKVTIPLAVLPLVAFVVAVVMQFLMLLLSSMILLANSVGPEILWTQWSILSQSLVLLYGLVTLALWYAPIYGWMLLISGWARRAPFLWAVLPPIVIQIFEKIAFGTSYFGALMKYRVQGSFKEAFVVEDPHLVSVDLAHLDPVRFLSSTGLWTGLAFAAACVAAAIWLRRYREPL
jgi:ABC-2 type transport system permease protein